MLQASRHDITLSVYGPRNSLKSYNSNAARLLLDQKPTDSIETLYFYIAGAAAEIVIRILLCAANECYRNRTKYNYISVYNNMSVNHYFHTPPTHVETIIYYYIMHKRIYCILMNNDGIIKKRALSPKR